MYDRDTEIREIYEKLVEDGYRPSIAKEAAEFGVRTLPLIQRIHDRIFGTCKNK